MEAIRSWFLRDVLDYIERDRGSEALTRLGERLPDRLGEILDPATLRTSAPTETVPIATGEDALLSIESALGDGSGKVLEGIGREMATRFLSHGGAVMTGDLIGTLSRLRVPFEHPFIGVDLTYEIQRTPGGFSMTVGAAGHPRATRILRHLASGAILAAQRGRGMAVAPLPAVEAAVFGDLFHRLGPHQKSTTERMLSPLCIRSKARLISSRPIVWVTNTSTLISPRM